jgi:dipeptidase E
MKATLFLVGGGEIGNGETYPLDQKIRSFCPLDNPHLLFLPTASNDAESYTEAVRGVYGGMGCDVEPLCLVHREPTLNELQEALAWANLIYIGGGNTRDLLDSLQRTGLDHLLIQALDERKDLVVAGYSAGASMWCQKSYADCDITDGKSDKMVFLDCLGYLPIVFNPHAQDEERKDFEKDLEKENFHSAYSLENDTALLIQGKKVQSLLKGYDDKRGWKITKAKNGRLNKQEL